MAVLEKIFGSYSKRELKKVGVIKDKVMALEEKYKAMPGPQLQSQTKVLKERLANGETLDDILPDAYAVCREAGFRTIGQRAYPVQIIGGIVLHQGRIAEMKTGEGKTLTATLPSYLNALTEKGVHVVTVNEYLAKHQAEAMGKIYKYLGLTVGIVMNNMSPEQKKVAYDSDITYGTNNEMGFDYLRDNMVTYKAQKVQRDYNYAIVDEVDSILIDEARTPLIISGQGDKSTEMYATVDSFAKRLTVKKIVEKDNKEEDDEEVDAHYIVDEKGKTATLTKKGIDRAEEHFKIDNLMDTENLTLLHHINQAIKAHGTMHENKDYVVVDGEVVIVDEFTGRMMNGRRYSDGLHQAIEAKEGVKVERESKTLATVTFQNYFRIYKKLSGMTGTALTEEAEFSEIYNLDIIAVPTNHPPLRIDYDDAIFKTVAGKYTAVIEQVLECNKTGQPVLVGTVSVEKSELLSKMLKAKKVKHAVLNAKFHEQEAEIIAQAGKKGAITIATNMAGRGTDILLGGNAEFLAIQEFKRKGHTDEETLHATSFAETDDEAILKLREQYQALEKKFKEQLKPDVEEVRNLGGLFIIGTERHETRRIDNQLRGRSGRQGDPGSSRFFLSLEDDLMRLFGGDKIQVLMDRLNIDENQAIENKILSNQIESAQRKVEGRNFSIRKNVLQYDDVMNTQRTIMYGQRDKVLNDDNLKEIIVKMIDESIEIGVDTFLADTDIHDDWNLEGLRSHYLGWLTTEEDFHHTSHELEELEKEDFAKILIERAKKLHAEKEEELPDDKMREIERVLLLKNVDAKWIDHIDAMDELRRGISLRSMGQRDPILAYRTEGFEMFDEMIASIREETVKMLLTIKIRKEEEIKRETIAQPMQAIHGEQNKAIKKMPVRSEKIGRNDDCPCGSGKKYKKCCGENES